MKEKIIAFMFTILPHHLISRVVGWFAHTKIVWIKNPFIKCYIKFFNVDMSESKIQNPEDFENFNAFFTRELVVGARVVSQQNYITICPVDGGVSELGKIDKNKLFQAKGKHYTLEALLGNAGEASTFENGSFCNLYLSPKDYHRIHMPISGKLMKMIYVPGRLFSVSPISVSAIDNLFARNERVIAFFDTELGLMAMVLVGAMIVASIETQWHGVVVPNRLHQITEYTYDDKNIVLEKGAEMGKFMLGSTVILLFEQHRVAWKNNLANNTPVKMGELLANFTGGD